MKIVIIKFKFKKVANLKMRKILFNLHLMKDCKVEILR